MEILAPAGSPEALFAAVYNGADAVYLGVENFNARKNAQNFSNENIGQYIDFCRQRGDVYKRQVWVCHLAIYLYVWVFRFERNRANGYDLSVCL